MDSWFREIHVSRAWRVHLATGFDFHEKNRAFFGSIGVPYAGFRLLPCHYTMKEGQREPFFPKLRIRIIDNNSSPHGKFHRFLFPFSCKFPDLNFSSYVLYIYLCGTHSEPGLPVVTAVIYTPVRASLELTQTPSFMLGLFSQLLRVTERTGKVC